MTDDLNVVAIGQKIGPTLTRRSNCALLKIYKALQSAIVVVEEEMETRIERKSQ